MKLYLLKTMLLLCALVVGSSAWAETKTATLDMSSSQTSPVTVNGVTFSWNSSNIVTGGGNSSGFKANSSMTVTLPTGSTLTTISKTNGNNWGSGATVVVYAGSDNTGTQIASIVTGTQSYTVSSNNTGGTFYFTNSTAKNAWIKSLTITYEVADFTINATSNNPSWGTVSLSDKVITASPTDGYRVSSGTPYTVTSGEAEVTQNGNTFSINPSTDCTVQINFEAIPKHTVTWSVNGTVMNTEEIEDNASVNLSAPSSGIPAGYSFIGWTTVEVTIPQNSSPEIVTEATCTSDITYYAVMAIVDDSKGSLTKMTSIDTFSNDDKIVVVVTGKTLAMYEETINTSYIKNFVFDGKVESIAADSKKWWTVTSDKQSGWYLGDNSNGYLYSNSSNNLSASTAYKSSFTLSWSSEKNAFTLVANDRWLSCRTDLTGSNKDLFRLGGLTSSTPSGSAYFDIYKYVAPSLSYSNYCTTVAAATVTISLNAACTDGEMVYGTYSNSSAFVVSDDIVVSEVSIIDGKLYVEEYETGDVVPANTGVMVSALEGGDYTVTLTSEAGTSVLGEDNMLRPTGEGITAAEMAAADTDCLYYRLTMQGDTQIGFWWGAEDGAAFAVAANKAYLAVPNDAEGARMSFWIGSENTGIADTMLSTKNSDSVVYDLQGRRVVNATKGLYIVEGKKVLVK